MKTKLLFTLFLIPLFNFSQIRLVKDVFAGSNSSNPTNYIEFNGKLYFFTENNGFSTSRINVTNGFESGTFNIVDNNNNPLINANNPDVEDWGILNGELFFAAQNLFDGVELYKTTGLDNTAELVLDLTGPANGNSSNPNNFVNINSGLLFSANDGVNGRELWFTVGSTAGTVLLKDINVGSGNSSPEDLFFFNGSVYFTANDGVNGNELWISDGTEAGTLLLKDIAVGPTDSTPRNFISYNGKVYFTANDGVFGRELWVTDGTTSGTVLVQDLFTGSTNSSPSELTVFNDNLVFAANVSGVGIELVKMNPAQNITSLGNINPTGNSSPQNLTVYNGFLYFSATNGVTGRELYRTNGFSSGTGIVIDLDPGAGNPTNFFIYNGNLYFQAFTVATGIELWFVDSNNIVSLAADIVNGGGSSIPVPQIVYGDEMILNIQNAVIPSIGIEPWAFIDSSFQTFVPDDDFEQQLINQGFDSVLDDFVTTANIFSTESISLDGSSGFAITDFTGLEDFKSLKTFQSILNNEAILDFSQNANLEVIEITDFNLSNLTLNPISNPNLREFIFGFTQLTTLDLSGFNKLELIFCGFPSSQLTTVDVSNNTSAFLNVNLSEATALETLTSDNATALTSLGLVSGNLTNLDLSTNINLSGLSLIGVPLTELDLSNNSALTSVNIFNSQLSTINVKNGNNTILTTFNSLTG
ncbi:MAG: ELWxxDGT repeat protein, partial [Olleya sp.]